MLDSCNTTTTNLNDSSLPPPPPGPIIRQVAEIRIDEVTGLPTSDEPIPPPPPLKRQRPYEYLGLNDGQSGKRGEEKFFPQQSLFRCLSDSLPRLPLPETENKQQKEFFPKK